MSAISCRVPIPGDFTSRPNSSTFSYRSFVTSAPVRVPRDPKRLAGLSSELENPSNLVEGGIELFPRLRGRGATAGCLVQLGVREAFHCFGCGWRGQRYGVSVHAGSGPPRNAAGSRGGLLGSRATASGRQEVGGTNENRYLPGAWGACARLRPVCSMILSVILSHIP